MALISLVPCRRASKDLTPQIDLPGGIAIGMVDIMAAPFKLEKQINSGIGFYLVHAYILCLVFSFLQTVIWIVKQATTDKGQ